MGKTCLGYIALFCVIAIVIFLYVYLRYPADIEAMGLLTQPPEWMRSVCAAAVSLPAAFFASMGLGFLHGVWQKFAERSLIQFSIHGGLPINGKNTAAAGVITPLASPLTAPISGSPCVAYNYEICHTGIRAGKRITDFHGFSLSPFVIQTAVGPVRLLNYPEFDFRENAYDDEETFQRARK